MFRNNTSLKIDFVPPLLLYQIFVSPYLFESTFEISEISLQNNKMEEIDEHLLIASIEVSCWKD